MKKILALSAIVLASAVSAQTLSVKYDGQKYNDVTTNTHEVKVGLISDKTEGFGIEGYLVSDSTRGGASNAQATGFEVATTYQLSTVYGVTPVARLGYGQKQAEKAQLDVSYWTVGVDGRLPAGNITYLVGFNHRTGVNAGDGFRSNQVSVGAEFSLTKRMSIETRLAHTNAEGFVANGIQAGINYAF